MDRIVLQSSAEPGFFGLFDGCYATLRRAGLGATLELVRIGGAEHWAILVPTEAEARASEVLGAPTARAGVRSSAAGGGREAMALLLLQSGEDLEGIARRLPNRAKVGLSLGVSTATAEAIVRRAGRVLLRSVVRDRRPDWVPDSLWPPPEVQRKVRAAPPSSGIRVLNAWLASRRPAGRRAPLDDGENARPPLASAARDVLGSGPLADAA